MVETTLKNLKKDIYLLMHKAQSMIELTEEGFMKNKVASLDQADDIGQEISRKEDALTALLAGMAGTDGYARSVLSAPLHIEKIAAAIKRISDGSRDRIRGNLLFSDKAADEIGRLFEKTKEVLKKAGEAAVTGAQVSVRSALAESESLQRMADNFAAIHEERLVSGECLPKSSSTYLSILYAFEDVGSHVKDAVSRFNGS
jgi:Na+/phosphate symporter